MNILNEYPKILFKKDGAELKEVVVRDHNEEYAALVENFLPAVECHEEPACEPTPQPKEQTDTLNVPQPTRRRRTR